MDDEYRDIPITTINNEIIVKYQDKKILETVIVDLLHGVERENIHRLEPEEYNRKIREYIKKKQPYWREVVVKIDIEYPFEDKNMRGVRIIDSPGFKKLLEKIKRMTLQQMNYIDIGRCNNVFETYYWCCNERIESNSFKEFFL